MLGQQFGPFINLTMKKQSDTVSSQIHKSIRIVKASDGQCQSSNGPGFNSSILRRISIWGAADEAALDKAHPTMEVCQLPHSCFWQLRTSQLYGLRVWSDSCGGCIQLHLSWTNHKTVDWQLRKTVAHDKKKTLSLWKFSSLWMTSYERCERGGMSTKAVNETRDR